MDKSRWFAVMGISLVIRVAIAQTPNSWDALTAGWSRQPLQYSIQHPWDLNESDRYSKTVVGQDTTYTFWINPNDKSHAKGNTTQPRTEMRVLGQDYRNKGQHQFEADFYIVPGTTGVIIFQIKEDGSSVANVFLSLRIIRNNLCSGEKPIMPIMMEKWYHLNVVHNAETGPMRVYVDGELKETSNNHAANVDAGHYFKCGVYNMSKWVEGRNESRYRNIKIWAKGTASLSAYSMAASKPLSDIQGEGMLSVFTLSGARVGQFPVSAETAPSLWNALPGSRTHGVFITILSDRTSKRIQSW